MTNVDKIVEVIEEVIETTVEDYSNNLFNQGLDSLGVLKLITILEEELSIEIDDNDLTVENMFSVNSIINMLNKYVHE